MGFLDTLLGKSKLPKPKSDKLFAMSTAYVTLSSNLGLKSRGAGICFKPLEASDQPIACAKLQRNKYSSYYEKRYLWVSVGYPFRPGF